MRSIYLVTGRKTLKRGDLHHVLLLRADLLDLAVLKGTKQDLIYLTGSAMNRVPKTFPLA